MHRYWHPYFEAPGDGGGGPDVQNLSVPGPDESDIETLAGDDEGDDDGEEGQKPEARQREDQKDDESGDEEDEERGEQKSKKKEREPDFDVELDEDEEVDEETGQRKEKSEVEEEEPAKGPYKALKQAYPDIFKKFPDLRRTIGEHQRFRSIFASADEAIEIVRQADNFVTLSDKILSGDFESLVEEMEKEDKSSIAKLAHKVLPTLKAKNKDLYFDIVDPAIQEFLYAAYQRANASGDERLKNSTYYLNGFLTSKKGFPTGASERPPDPREKEVEEKIQAFENKKLNEARGSVSTDIRGQLSHRIEQALDPTGKMLKGKDATKKALVNAIMGEIDDNLAKDEIHLNKVNRLWQHARRSSFSQAHLSRIINAYLERANQELPKLAKKVRTENGLDEAGNKEERTPAPQSKNRPPARVIPGGKPAQVKSLRDVDPRKIDYKRTSDDDIFSGKVRTRR